MLIREQVLINVGAFSP